MAQLDDKSRKALHINLNNRIRSAEDEIQKLTTKTTGEGESEVTEKIKYKDLPKKSQDQVQYLHTRIKHFQISLRLAFNTEWLIEQRKEDIKTLAERLRTEFGPGAEMDDTKRMQETKVISTINALTKAVRCKRKGCYIGRGYSGLNISTGEFELCKCTRDTIDHYNLTDKQ